MTSLIVSSRPARHAGIMRSRLSPQGLAMGHVLRSPGHAGRARRRRQSVAPQTVRAASHRREPRLALRSLPRQGPRRIRRGAETLAGATLGAVPPVTGYFRRVRELYDRHGILLILDEVMCGMGRCGRLWAFEDEGIVPDMVTIAKGLGAGYQPIGAVVVAKPVYDTIVGGSGFFQHGYTYIGHAAACAGALAS